MSELNRAKRHAHSKFETTDALGRAVPGVILAGGSYGVSIVIATWLLASLYGGGDEIDLVAIGIVIAFLVGCVIAAISCLLAAFMMTLINWTLGMIFTTRAAVSIFGGWCGFLSCMPAFIVITLSLVEDNGLEASVTVLIPFGCIFLAVLYGHIGAIASAYSSRQKPLNEHGPSEKWVYQFKISQLLVGTVWVAIIAGLTNIVGPLLPVWLIVGCVFQLILLGIDRLWLSYCVRISQ